MQLVCVADVPSLPMQSGSLAQYGAPQYGNQQAAAAAPAPITLPARPAAQAGTFSTTSYNRPSAQSRPAASPAAAVPAFGRPTVQAPTGNRAAMRPAKGAATATPAVPAAPAGKAHMHRHNRCPATTCPSSPPSAHPSHKPFTKLLTFRLDAAEHVPHNTAMTLSR